MAQRKQIVVELLGEAKELRKSLQEASAETESFGKRLTQRAGLIGGSIVGVLAGFGAEGIKGLMEQDTAQKNLADALSRTTGAFKQSQAAMQANAEELQRSTKFSDEDILAVDTQIAKSKALVSAINSGKISQEALTQSTLDMATVMGTDGPSAANTLAKALANPGRAARMLQTAHVELNAAQQAQIKAWVKAGDVGKAQTLILQQVEKQTKGAADAAGNTLPGKLARAKHSFEEVEKQLTAALLPAVTAILDKLLKVTAWAEENPGKMKAIIAVVGGLAGALLAVSVATKVWTAATKIASAVTKVWTAIQWALNTSLLGCPLLLIIAGVVGLTVGIIELYRHSATFRAIVQSTFHTALTVIQAVWNWTKKNWPLLLGILMGPIGLAVVAIAKNWDRIKHGAMVVFDAIKAAWDNTIGRLQLPAVVGKVAGAVGGALGHIPGFASGGFVPAGQLSVVGENGPELFMSGTSGTVIPNHALRGGGNQHVTLHLDLTGADDDMLRRLRKQVRLQTGGDVQMALGS